MAETKRKLDDWLATYRDYTQGTESPATFHLWVALSVLAAAAQRKISIDFGYYPVHTNQYIVLTGDPGVVRKSTAIRIGKGLLKGLIKYGQEIHFSTQATSVAALVKQLTTIENKEHQSLTAFSSELASLLGAKPNEITDFLTDIYDCDPDWDKQTVGRGLEKIEFPWLNLLAATTPQWLGDNLSKTAVEGGFVARSLFVFEDTPGPLVAFPELTPEQVEMKKWLTHDLSIISTLKGQVKFSPDAKAYYKQWYENPKRKQVGFTDSRIKWYYERKHIHVLKVAMGLMLAKSNQLMLELPAIETAIQLLTQIEPGMRRAFSGVGNNVHATVIDRIRDMIRMEGKVAYKRLLASFINDVRQTDFDELLKSLVAMGEVKWDAATKFLEDARRDSDDD